MSVKSVLKEVLDAARERESELEGIIARAREFVARQSTGRMDSYYDCCVGMPGKCPDERLKDLWNALSDAASGEDGESFMEASDFDLILAVAPQLTPSWFQKMVAESKMVRVPCPHCGAKGYTVEERK